MAKRFYELEVAGVKRSLPVINISDTLARVGVLGVFCPKVGVVLTIVYGANT